MERIENKADLDHFIHERTLAKRLRDAVGFCKGLLELDNTEDTKPLEYEEKVNFEKCLVENYLVKHGMDYFGKRDLIYVDMQGDRDIERLYTRELIAEVGEEEAAEMGADVEDAGEDE